MNYKKISMKLLLIVFLILPGKFIFAETVKSELAYLKEQIQCLEKRLDKQEMKSEEHGDAAEYLSKIKEVFNGISMNAGITTIAQGTYNANGDNLSKPEDDTTDASYSMDLEFENDKKSASETFSFERKTLLCRFEDYQYHPIIILNLFDM